MTDRKDWPTVDDKGDYIWRFSLDPGSAAPQIAGDGFAELFRSQLDEMLKLVVLTYHGQRVRVDGFHFVHEPEIIHPIWSAGDEAEKE
jgi:hypothetical protein